MYRGVNDTRTPEALKMGVSMLKDTTEGRGNDHLST